MKPALERTAVLSKDITEQPDGDYIVFLTEAGVTLTAAGVEIDESVVNVYADAEGDELLATFPATVPWLMVRRSRIEVVSREAQLRRMAETHTAELTLAKTLGMVDEPVAPAPAPTFERQGQYL